MQTSRILIIDDSRDAAISMAMFLRKFGYQTYVINQPELLRSSLHEYRPAIILLDLAMPGMDGIEAAHQLRSEGFTGSLIAVTGFADEAHRQRAAEVGFDHYLVKPVHFPTLMTVLKMGRNINSQNLSIDRRVAAELA